MSDVTTDLIGKRFADRHSCTDADHLPNCHNPWHDLTACVCGAVWWRGQVGTWHSRALYRETGRTPGGNPVREVEAWDRYFLHAPGCGNRRVVPAAGHVCGGSAGSAGITAAEAFGRAA